MPLGLWKSKWEIHREDMDRYRVEAERHYEETARRDAEYREATDRRDAENREAMQQRDAENREAMERRDAENREDRASRVRMA
jgi:hypothetical protein